MSLTTVLDTIDKGTAYLEKKGIDDARRNMQLLVTHQLGCSRVELYMQFDRPMNEEELAPLRDQLLQRGRGVPLQHLLGTVEFYRREFKSDSRALIPRPETEELADILLKHPALQPPVETNTEPVDPAIADPDNASQPSAADEQACISDNQEPDDHRLRILDMGTGSGVLGLTLAHELGGRCKDLTLADISAEALDLAKENAELLGTARVRLLQSDLFSELDGEKFDLITANLPYIPTTERAKLSTEVMNDPESALFGGEDGLDIIRNFITQAPGHLHPGGMVALEISNQQSTEVENLLQQAGFHSVRSHCDLNAIPRFPVAFWACPDSQND